VPHTCPKSPLAPPFDYAQGMLFQRGGMLISVQIPPLKNFEKGGLRGIFLANGEYNLTKSSIVKFQ
jgi:hypothetical protein